ncbi:hypothetical protein D7B24_000463 [Verticillium nonalfalfae]|uniref:Uncharacterized protein n=1 Tax=Verticillium nonalfalfae TaxID=1051616 RepID=A0A3M9Y1R1_9PEZI|nr:uncharacterized protein D7B24_000463 [Verticillium nonalfalfae]RNJ54447.1 hypothetical protein D7B24_000463 [Verticillium nonalfalfae]
MVDPRTKLYSGGNIKIQSQPVRILKSGECPCVLSMGRVWGGGKFCKIVLSKVGPSAASDPETIVLDLCANRPSAEDKFRAFLRHHVKTSMQLRPSLGPEEYEWVREVESAITVTELWKALVRDFDSGFLQIKRREEPEKTSSYSLKFTDTSQGSGSVWKVSKV